MKEKNTKMSFLKMNFVFLLEKYEKACDFLKVLVKITKTNVLHTRTKNKKNDHKSGKVLR